MIAYIPLKFIPHAGQDNALLAGTQLQEAAESGTAGLNAEGRKKTPPKSNDEK